MPAPVITNIFNNENPLTAYVGEPFSAKIPVSNTPTRLSVTGSWIGWSYRWLSATDEVELYITPTRLLKILASIDQATGLPITDEATYTGIRMQAFNDDGGSNIAILPFSFIHRAPIIDDIPTQEWTRGQTGIDFTVRIEHKPNAVAVRGDLLGLAHETSGEGVRIFGDIADGDFTKPRGTFTIDAVNATGPAPQKTGVWGIRELPYQPTGVTFTAGSGQITLMWELLSYPDLTRAEVKIATSSSGLSLADWTTADSDTQHTFRNLRNGTTYYFQVRGLNALGYGPASDVFSASPQTVPTAPTGLAVSVGDEQMLVTWDYGSFYPPLDNQEFRIATSQAGLASATPTTLAASVRRRTVQNLNNGTTYYVQVRGRNAVGLGPASLASGRPQSVPRVPANVALTARNEEIEVSWTITPNYPAVDRQEVRIATSPSRLTSATWTNINSATATSYTFRNLENGTTYYIQVHHRNSVGYGPASVAVSATPTGLPGIPTGLRVARGEQQLRTSWTIGASFPALQKQQIRWATTPDGLALAGWTDLTATATSYTITDLDHLTTYSVEVRGVNSEGAGAAARASGQTYPERAVPGATTVSLTPGDHELVATWALPTAYPALDKQQIRWATTELGLQSASWTDLTATAMRHVISQLVNGTTYYVQVRGVNAEGEGTVSTVVSQTPQGVPEAPTGFALTVGDKQLTANWTLPQAYPALQKQQIRWADSTTAVATASWTDLTATAVKHVISNLINGTTYSVQVRGVNAEGEGTVSTTQSAIPQGIPDAPTSVSIVPENTQLIVSWTIGHAYPALQKQQIRWATSDAGLSSASWTDLTATAVRHVISQLVNGTTYYVQVRGVNAEGEGVISDTVSGAPSELVIPTAPTNLKVVSNTRTSASLAWEAATGIPAVSHYQYRVRRHLRVNRLVYAHATQTDWTSTGTANLKATVTLDQITGYAPGVNIQVYTIDVRAVNDAGTGPASGSVEIEIS